MEKPLVSICLITYNHVEFIERALESALSQVCEFAFEVVIGDDASSDGTSEICEQFALKYPSIVRYMIRSRDDVIYKHGKPTGISNMLKTLKDCRGKYIALLEGDDFWVNAHKLQSQVTYLEKNQKVSGVFHQTKILDMNQPEEQVSLSMSHDSWVGKTTEHTLDEVLQSGSIAPTASLVFRSSIVQHLPNWYTSNPSDWKIEIMIAMHGYFVELLNAPWSVYRVHNAGIWSNESIGRQLVYRTEQALDLMNDPRLSLNRVSIRKYIAHTYQVSYEQLRQSQNSRRVVSIKYLIQFLRYADLSVSIKLKHGLKELFKILR